MTDALIPIIRNSQETGAIKYLYARETMQFAQNDQQKNQLIQLMGTTGHYQAMLFVAPFMDQPTTSEAAAVAAMNIAIANPSFAGEETTAILNKVSKTLSNPDADYQRQSITKYLSENPTEGGFVSMFNGKNLDGWKGLVENPIQRANMSARKLAAAQKEADEEAARDYSRRGMHRVLWYRGAITSARKSSTATLKCWSTGNFSRVPSRMPVFTSVEPHKCRYGIQPA